MDAVDSMSLAGRVVAIAGASGNLGPTVVRRLATSGARLALAGRDAAALDALAAEVGGDAHTAAVDLLEYARWNELYSALMYGAFIVLIGWITRWFVGLGKGGLHKS